jgi:hypothetical protein
VAAFSSGPYSKKEGIVALHSPDTNYNCFVLLLSEDHVCTSKIDALTYCSKTSTDVLKVVDMQLYDDYFWVGTGVQVLVKISGNLYLFYDIVNGLWGN